MRMGNYSNWNNSTLSQINRGNVANLKVKFMASLGDPGRPNKATQYFTPLVEDGFMYVGNQWQQYWKFDVRNEKPTRGVEVRRQGPGRRQERPQRRAARQQHVLRHRQRQPQSRAWSRSTRIPARWCSTSTPPRPEVVPNQGHSAAPLAVKNMIIIGQSNRDENGRGYLAAYTADTGKLLWRFLVVPDPGEPGLGDLGRSSAPFRPAAAASGPSRPTIRRPISSMSAPPIPVHMFDPQGRPGDNLYTNSIIALDVDTGQLKWHFQTVPNESWDYDAVAITQLYDVNDRRRDAQGHRRRPTATASSIRSTAPTDSSCSASPTPR